MTDGPTVAAIELPHGHATEVTVEPAPDSAMVVVAFGVDDDSDMLCWGLLPNDLCDALDRAIGRLCRAPLPSVTTAERSAPFDLTPVVTLRTEAPPFDVRESVEGLSRRARASKAFEAGLPTFDVHVDLKIHSIGATVRADIIGVPGDEVTISTMKMAAAMMGEAASEILRRQEAVG
jgi:hypothetical protein